MLCALAGSEIIVKHSNKAPNSQYVFRIDVTLLLMKRIGFIFGLLCLILVSVKCSKTEDNTGVPVVRVNRQIQVNLPANFNIQAIGGFDYYSGGSRGIIIYRLDNEQFHAYERHATYQPENGCAVEVDSLSIDIVDPCSDSRYSIIDGTVTQGPAVNALRRYQTSFENGILRVWN